MGRILFTKFIDYFECPASWKDNKAREILIPSHFPVRTKGLEPPRRKTPDPKSGAATNYATCAFMMQR